jgi:hypothetical protein
VFYCIDGIIYQSPCLLDLLRVRIAQVSLNLFSCFDELQCRIRYTSSNEHTLSLEKRKRAKTDEEVFSGDSDDDTGENKKKQKHPTTEDNNGQNLTDICDGNDNNNNKSNQKQLGSSASISGSSGNRITVANSAAVIVSSKSLPNFNKLLNTIRSDRFIKKEGDVE